MNLKNVLETINVKI